MKGYNEAFQDIPGTVVFDATQSRLGYHLNQFCMSLMKAENRAAFKANERAYLLLPVGLPGPGCRVPALAKKPLDQVLVRR